MKNVKIKNIFNIDNTHIQWCTQGGGLRGLTKKKFYVRYCSYIVCVT